MKVMKPVCRFLSCIGIIISLLLFNLSVSVTKSSIFVNKFLSFSPTEYHIEDIDKIVRYDRLIAPNGNLVDREQIFIYSNGIEVWNNDILFLNNNPESDAAFIRFILNKNQLEIEERGIYKD